MYSSHFVAVDLKSLKKNLKITFGLCVVFNLNAQYSSQESEILLAELPSSSEESEAASSFDLGSLWAINRSSWCTCWIFNFNLIFILTYNEGSASALMRVWVLFFFWKHFRFSYLNNKSSQLLQQEFLHHPLLRAFFLSLRKSAWDTPHDVIYANTWIC